MKTSLRPRWFLTLGAFAVVGTTVIQLQSHPVGIPVFQSQSMSHASCCQQCIGHPQGSALTRVRAGFLTSCWETTLSEEPQVCWRMPSLVSLALALVKSLAPQHWSCFCVLRGRELMQFMLQSLPLLGEVLLTWPSSTAYVDRSWLKQGLNIVVPWCDYSHIQGRWWKINEECIIVFFYFVIYLKAISHCCSLFPNLTGSWDLILLCFAFNREKMLLSQVRFLQLPVFKYVNTRVSLRIRPRQQDF